MTVTEIQSRDNLPKKSPRFLGREAALLDEVVEQFSPTHVLQHQVQVLEITHAFVMQIFAKFHSEYLCHLKCFVHLPVLVDIVQREDVLMLDELHDGNLPLDLLQHGLAQLLLVDDLDGNLLAHHTVGTQLHQA